MAKIKTGLIRPNGKLGDHVFIDSKHGDIIRKAITPGLKKDEPELKKQFSRTGFLNKIASEINAVVQQYNRPFKDGQFYQSIQSRLRAEPENNRFLLLQQLKGLEVNPKYKLEKLLQAYITANYERKQLQLSIHIQRHPDPGKYNANGYDLELLLVCWNKTTQPPITLKQLSPWISLQEETSVIDFVFPQYPGATQWMLILRVRLAVDGRYVPAFVAEGMQVVAVGSFDKKERMMWEKRLKEKNEKRNEVVHLEKKEEVREGVIRGKRNL